MHESHFCSFEYLSPASHLLSSDLIAVIFPRGKYCSIHLNMTAKYLFIVKLLHNQMKEQVHVQSQALALEEL